MKTIELTHFADFSEALAGREIVSYGVGSQGEAVLLVVAPADKDKPFARFGRGVTYAASEAAPYDAAVLTLWPHLGDEIRLTGVRTAFPNIQTLPDGGVLLLSARERSKRPNAVVYTRDGAVQRTFSVGDGVQDVQVARDGSIWVSYFDEGVFSGDPLTEGGLVTFSALGEVISKYHPPPGFGHMADCYAMNVAAREVWLCYYTDFPIVRVPLYEGFAKGWTNDYSGARALATDGRRVALFGGYQSPERCVVQEFGDDKMVRAREVELVLPNGELPERVKVVGRGSALHFFVGTAWYQLDLHQHDM